MFNKATLVLAVGLVLVSTAPGTAGETPKDVPKLQGEAKAIAEMVQHSQRTPLCLAAPTRSMTTTAGRARPLNGLDLSLAQSITALSRRVPWTKPGIAWKIGLLCPRGATLLEES
jgi:hypothetical protein